MSVLGFVGFKFGEPCVPWFFGFAEGPYEA